MPPKLIKPGTTHGYIGQKPKSKAKPREIVDWTIEYRRQRDMILLNDMFVCEGTKEEIRKKYGI